MSVTVVVVTRNRREQLAVSLAHHRAPVILVDNGSNDGTPAFVRNHFPHVDVIELGRNAGAVARNFGVQHANTELVAFADDDSWWATGALDRAAEIFDEHPKLVLLNGRILVGEADFLDPVCREMAESPLGVQDSLPGPSVLGFLACGAIFRREAFLDIGGFDDVVFFLGEEERVALDLRAAGWALCYVDEVIAHHRPSNTGDRQGRRRLQLRNRILTAVLRRPWRIVAKEVLAALRVGMTGLLAVCDALRRARRGLTQRRRLPSWLESERRLLDK